VYPRAVQTTLVTELCSQTCDAAAA